MAKLIVLYRKPANPDEFNDYYFNVHVPIAKQIPGITAYEVSEGPVATPQGDSSWHLVATLGFATMDALQAAFASPEGQRAAADLANFADAGAELLIVNERSI